MTRGSRSLPLEMRYYFLILGSNYLGMENFGANRKDHSDKHLAAWSGNTSK
jgi:hypothetical protein